MSLKPSLRILAGLAAIKENIQPTDITTSDDQDNTKILVTEACKDIIEFLSQEYPLNDPSKTEYTKQLKSKYIQTLAAFNIQKKIALHDAVEKSDINQINALLDGLNNEERVALLQIKNEYSNTALHKAASFGNVEIINALLDGLNNDKRVALLQFKDKYDNTVLHKVVREGRVGTINALNALLQNLNNEERVALLQIKDNNGYTALHIVTRLERIVTRLERIVTRLERVDTINALLQNLNNEDRVDLLQIQDNDGNTALHFAAKWGVVENINALLRGLNNEERVTLLQVKDKYGYTALHLAVYEDSEDFIGNIISTREEKINALLEGLLDEQKAQLGY